MKIYGGKPPEGQDVYLRAQKAQGKDATGKSEQLQGSKRVADRVEVSGKAKEINEMKAEIQRLPEVRTDRVETIRQAIESGTYGIDPGKILSRMLEEI
ncbi:MAG TPA: flagellar biosynthesis anti-sigma factor FlgM [Nitrospirae bacterium]|mgnify:CR=1 FL=1|nr:flagellar biosynthesis anti-sigma factor FlgM [Nitrospirota bacterium]